MSTAVNGLRAMLQQQQVALSASIDKVDSEMQALQGKLAEKEVEIAALHATLASDKAHATESASTLQREIQDAQLQLQEKCDELEGLRHILDRKDEEWRAQLGAKDDELHAARQDAREALAVQESLRQQLVDASAATKAAEGRVKDEQKRNSELLRHITALKRDLEDTKE